MTAELHPLQIYIVSDSGAHFPHPSILEGQKITIAPYSIQVGDKTYLENVDLNKEQVFRLFSQQATAPKVTAPTVEEYVNVYTHLARQGATHIISIHSGKEITQSWNNAKLAAEKLSGHCKIEVVDSGSISTGQALVVGVAIRAITDGKNFDEVVQLTRGAADRVYSVYYTETLDYLIQSKIITPSHGILGTMLNIKPFITIENGQISLIEKVRSRIQAIEKLVEFASEFIDVEEIIILQHKAHHSEQTRMLTDRLVVDFPNHRFTATLYGASLAALIGTDATGLVILETQIDESGDITEDIENRHG